MGGYSVIDASAGGAFLTATGRPVLGGARLVAGAAADATAIVRETNGSGRVLCSLAALAKTSDEAMPMVQYTGNVHVTVVGAGATVLLYQP